jgi:lysophospholipase L1-like esterase
MKRKIVLMLVALFMVSAMLFAFTACNDDEDETPTKTIVYLGDSIAEAIAGPSPLTERENYGYYALIGRRNNYYYYNRSVSGHKTEGLVDIVTRETEDAYTTLSLLKKADIIHISILGNNFLQNDLGKMILETAQGSSRTIDLILDGGEDIDAEGEKVVYTDARQDIADVVERLKELNPDAVIFFQNVYNPVFEGTSLISEEARAALAETVDAEGKYGEAGAYITTTEQFRAIANEMLSKLNGVLSAYLEEHPGAFYILDARTEFERVYAEDPLFGRSLIFYDWVHPSNAGHAVLADLTQAKLEELGLADHDKAVQRYKEIRKEQLNRMFNYTASAVDIGATVKAINDSDTCGEVTRAYFKAIYGVQPQYC